MLAMKVYSFDYKTLSTGFEPTF